MERSNIIITCSPRMSPILAEEVTSLGFSPTKVGHQSVELAGTYNDTMFLNLKLRTATRVLYLLKTFDAPNPDKLYKEIYDIPWEDYFDADGYISISGYVDNPHINNPLFANLKVKDAICDRFTHKFRRRPNSGPDQDKSSLFLHWQHSTANIYIDTSGETIAKHGYRKIPLKAPMLEALAAGAILASRWDRKSHFVNPMCGSGTLAIEAAMMATNTAPGLLRDNFGFMHTKLYDPLAWKSMRKQAESEVIQTLDFKIIATDLNPRAVEAAMENASYAGMRKHISFEGCDFSKTPVPEDKPGVIFFNPEYGERLGDVTALETTYAQIGDFLKKEGKGYLGYIFTGNLNLAKKIGLRTKRRIEFYNSKIDCRLLEYELYAGTKKMLT